MWDIRYRPQKFADVLGQDGTVAVLKERLRRGTALDTSYIFVGAAGTGKTTLGRILAKAILCERLDPKDLEPCDECDNCRAILDGTSLAFTEQDAASQGTIENIRRIVDELPFGVMGAAKKIYVLDESHRLSNASQDVLLKPLEEKRLVGMFCTTEPEKIRAAIRSRCEEYQIRKVTREDILGRMKYILTKEGATWDDEAVLMVIDYCGGHVRDVINKTEMIAQMGHISVETVSQYLNLKVISTYYEILLAIPVDIAKALSLAEQACGRVTAEEVVAGLAEAAMNSWRLANKMHTDSSWIDRQLAERVWAQYGEACTDLAGYFTRSRYSTQIGLMCDLMLLARSVKASGTIPAPQAAVPPSIVITGTVGPSVTVPQLVQPLVSQQSVLQPAPTVPAKLAPPKLEGPKKRADGVGNRGEDPEALTEVDVFGVPPGGPKVNRQREHIQFTAKKESELTEPVSPADWSKQFVDSLGILGQHGLGDKNAK